MPGTHTELDDLLRRLNGLSSCAQALHQFALSLHPNADVDLKGERWVFEPNFVTLTPHWKRVTNIGISLRGHPDEFAVAPELPLRAGMSGYSECTFDSPRQLGAACRYVERAYELFRRGRTREKMSQVVREIPI